MIIQIYKLYCVEGWFYIGSTKQKLLIRYSEHIRKCLNNSKENKSLYEKMNEIGAYKWMIMELEHFEVENKKEQLIKENEFIQMYINDEFNINKYKSYRSKEDIENYQKEYNKKYRDDNKEKISENKKEYMKEYNKTYFKKRQESEEFREKKKAYLKEYHQKKKSQVS